MKCFVLSFCGSLQQEMLPAGIRNRLMAILFSLRGTKYAHTERKYDYDMEARRH